jgi:hypothetical protein
LRCEGVVLPILSTEGKQDSDRRLSARDQVRGLTLEESLEAIKPDLDGYIRSSASSPYP